MSENQQAEDTAKTPSRKFYVITSICAVVVFLLFFFNAQRRRHHTKEEAEKASAPTKTVVNIVKPTHAADTSVLVLPGTIQGIRETSLYARVNGFVKNWFVDIGDKVKEGQLLAELETPELDQQLDQAKAALDLAKSSLDRVNSVTIAGAVSVQQKADRQGAYATSLAQYNQLLAQKSFKHVVAPFAGIITSRNIDIGTLINAGSSASQQLFTLAQVDRLRIFVDVPQTFASFIQIGTPASIVVQEIGGDPMAAKVTRTAGALNADTRTLRTQVEFDNPEKNYSPGMYAKVKFNVSQPMAKWRIPANALIIRTAGPQVVTLTKDTTIAIKNVFIDKDYGATLDIASGINGDEKLVTNAGLDLTEGLKVQIAKPTSKGEKTPGDKKK